MVHLRLNGSQVRAVTLPFSTIDFEKSFLLFFFLERDNVLVEHVLHAVVLTFNIFHILDQRWQGVLETLEKQAQDIYQNI